MVKTLQLRRPMNLNKIPYCMTVLLPWGVRPKCTPEKPKFFFSLIAALPSHRDRLVNNKGCDTSKATTTAVSQGGP